MIDTSIVRVHHPEPEAVDGTVTGWIDQQDSCAVGMMPEADQVAAFVHE